MSSRRRHVSPARRAISALVVGLWLFGLVGSLFHDGGHEHTYCSQHQTFEEIAGDARAIAGVASNTAENAAFHAGSATSYQHEACAFADLGVRAPLTHAVHVPIAAPTPPAPAAAPPVAHVSRPIPLLACAPKADPPACFV